MWIISGNEQYLSVRRPFRFDLPSILDEGVMLAQLRNSLILQKNSRVVRPHTKDKYVKLPLH